MTTGQGDLANGMEILTFPSLPWPDAVVGARLEVRASSVYPGGSGPLARGEWAMRATIIPSDWRSLPLPQTARLSDGVVVRYEMVGLSPSVFSVKVDVVGVRLVSGESTGTGPDPTLELIGPAGSRLTPLSGVSTGTSPEGVEITAFWATPPAGSYMLVLHEAGAEADAQVMVG